MTIHKHFKTIKDAEKHYMKLCNIYNSVKLVGWPMYTEYGNYSFKVND